MLFLSFFSFPVISVCMFVSVCECELCVCEQVNAFNTVSVIKIFTIVDNFDITVWKIIHMYNTAKGYIERKFTADLRVGSLN